MVHPKHIDKQTADGTAMNLEALYKLFPSCFTERPLIRRLLSF